MEGILSIPILTHKETQAERWSSGWKAAGGTKDGTQTSQERGPGSLAPLTVTATGPQQRRLRSRGPRPEPAKGQSSSVVSDSLQPHWLQPARLFCPWNSSGHNTGVGTCSLQGIFPTQGSNPGLLHYGKILYHLRHQGSPRILEWVLYPFSRSSQPRNRTGVTCIASRVFISWAPKPLEPGGVWMLGTGKRWWGPGWGENLGECAVLPEAWGGGVS